MTLTRSREPIPTNYAISNCPLPAALTIKLLGVTVSSDLRWNSHIDTVRRKSIAILGILAKCFRGGKAKFTRLLYISLVRSKLLYGIPSWSPTTMVNMEKLERVQSRATFLILGYKAAARLTRDLRLAACKLPSLSATIDSNTLTFFCKCLAGSYDLNVFGTNRVSIKARREGLRGGLTTLVTPRSTCNYYLASFFPRAVSLFNALDEKVKQKWLSVIPN